MGIIKFVAFSIVVIVVAFLIIVAGVKSADRRIARRSREMKKHKLPRNLRK